MEKYISNICLLETLKYFKYPILFTDKKQPYFTFKVSETIALK